MIFQADNKTKEGVISIITTFQHAIIHNSQTISLKHSKEWRQVFENGHSTNM